MDKDSRSPQEESDQGDNAGLDIEALAREIANSVPALGTGIPSIISPITSDFLRWIGDHHSNSTIRGRFGSKPPPQQEGESQEK